MFRNHPERIIVVLLIGFLAPLQNASAQEGLLAGAGLSAGVVGMEVLWRPRGLPLRVGTGAGVAGVGARLLLDRGQSGSPTAQLITPKRYLGFGYLLTPWSFGNIDAVGAVTAEVGVQILHPGQRLVADLAVGAFVVHSGSWGGYVVGPALRLQVGLQLTRIARQ